ncbi:MAG: glycosyltransferase [Cycloclasticus sp.]|nr:glycosyltransferase [Cycloclasticus sp.]
MKILNVNHTLDSVTGGGTAERTLQMSRKLIADGVSCSILTMDRGVTPIRLDGGKIIVIPSICRRFYIPKFLFYGIRSAVKDADIIHIMGHWTVLNALVYLVARSQKKPYVFCPAGALPVFGRSRWLKRVYNAVIGQHIVRNAERCIAITEAEKADFKDYGVEDESIVVIPNAVSGPELSSNDEVGFRKQFDLKDRPFILFLGRLNLIKGPDLLLHAFCQLTEVFPEIDLVFAGPDDGMLAELKETSSSVGVEGKVHFLGHIGGIDKFHAYRSAMLLVIPSRQEAMSLVVLEAGINGTPSVFTDQCGLDELVETGSGVMVSASVSGLAKGLIDTLSNREQLVAMKSNIREVVNSKFSWKVILRKYKDMYEALM